MSTIRGSVGGLTYSANQFAQIVMKNRIAPVQPNTTAQTLVRGCLNTASIAWLQLSQADRDLWDLYAQTVTYEGPQGSYTVTGRDIFIAGYSLQNYSFISGTAGQLTLDDPPVIAGKLVIASIVPSAGPSPGTGIGFTVNNLNLEAVTVLVNVSPPQNPTRMRYKGPWDSNLTAFKVAPLGLSTAFTIPGLVSGRVYFAMFRGVTKSTPARVTSRSYLRLVAATLP
jgi:hypothetical protein